MSGVFSIFNSKDFGWGHEKIGGDRAGEVDSEAIDGAEEDAARERSGKASGQGKRCHGGACTGQMAVDNGECGIEGRCRCGEFGE